MKNMLFNQFDSLKNSDKTFVIAEAGSNWKCGTYEDDLNQAKHLIRIAAKSGADAVKFQTYRSETTYVSEAGPSNYLSKNGLNKNINKIFDDLSMPYEMIPELANYAKTEHIEFMSSPFSVNDAKQIDPFVSIHKIASFEINHVRLVEFLAKTEKPLIISTGACTYDEIDYVVNLVKKTHNNIALLQCTSKYPCSLESLNLSVIPHMKTKYGVLVGFSDHSVDPIIGPIMAIGFGARIIEKHFTLDRNLSGPDHAFALIPNELELMIKSIRLADLVKGNGKKVILDKEIELRKFATRSIQAIKNISKGDILQEGINFDILRPGNHSRGLEARFLNLVNGKKSKKDLKPGDGIVEFE
jgi:N,N'-diacetyllegionaminate synthase